LFCCSTPEYAAALLVINTNSTWITFIGEITAVESWRAIYTRALTAFWHATDKQEYRRH